MPPEFHFHSLSHISEAFGGMIYSEVANHPLSIGFTFPTAFSINWIKNEQTFLCGQIKLVLPQNIGIRA